MVAAICVRKTKLCIVFASRELGLIPLIHHEQSASSACYDVVIAIVVGVPSETSIHIPKYTQFNSHSQGIAVHIASIVNRCCLMRREFTLKRRACRHLRVTIPRALIGSVHRVVTGDGLVLRNVDSVDGGSKCSDCFLCDVVLLTKTLG